MKLASAAILLTLFSAAGYSQRQTVTPTPTPEAIREEVVVTASRFETRLGDTPASVAITSRQEIEISAAPVIDDILRQTVGFSIFRRSSSRNANPTTQGVSLRGVGASGASRSIVMIDGIPLNDPFGGWIQWNRVSPIELDHAELLRGGASSLYGDGGLSGAVNLITQTQNKKLSFAADVFGGTQGTISGSEILGFAANGWSGSFAAAYFGTRGFVPVDEAVRGPVDSFAGTRCTNYSSRVERKIAVRSSVFVRPSYFGEVRTNGTGLQTNRTHIAQLAAGGRSDLGKTTNIEWRAFGGTQVYDQVFSAVNALRTAESLTRIQRVPVQHIGFSAQIRTTYKIHTIIGGIDGRNIRGASDEIGFANNVATVLTGAGGRQTIFGGFVQDLVSIGKDLIVVAGFRADHWQNYAAISPTRTLSSGQTSTSVFPDRVDTAVSPRLSALYRLSNSVSLYGSVSRSFRAPTLNELYRGFRVGNVLTLANQDLNAETATNVEGGLIFGAHRTYLRASGFRTAIDQPVANVTISSTPSLITRQRQNAGSTRAAGLEIESTTRFAGVSLTAGYMFVSSIVTSFPSNPALVGLDVPQVPRHQFTLQLQYSVERWTLATQIRASSSQYDDDLNQFLLEPYGQADVFVSRQMNEHLQIYAAFENIFNSRYSVAKTPIRSVSAPTTFRLGLRWK